MTATDVVSASDRVGLMSVLGLFLDGSPLLAAAAAALAATKERVGNAHFEVREWKDEVVFLRSWMTWPEMPSMCWR